MGIGQKLLSNNEVQNAESNGEEVCASPACTATEWPAWGQWFPWRQSIRPPGSMQRRRGRSWKRHEVVDVKKERRRDGVRTGPDLIFFWFTIYNRKISDS